MRAITPQNLPRPVLEASYSLGKLVLATRKAQGLSQADLALQSGIGRNTLIEIERGSPKVQFAHWLCVLDAIGQVDAITRHIALAMSQVIDAAPKSRSPR